MDAGQQAAVQPGGRDLQIHGPGTIDRHVFRFWPAIIVFPVDSPASIADAGVSCRCTLIPGPRSWWSSTTWACGTSGASSGSANFWGSNSTCASSLRKPLSATKRPFRPMSCCAALPRSCDPAILPQDDTSSLRRRSLHRHNIYTLEYSNQIVDDRYRLCSIQLYWSNPFNNRCSS